MNAIVAGVALYLWAGLSCYLAMRVMRIEAEAWIGRRLPPDEPGPVVSLALFLCIWWMSPLVLAYAVCTKWHPSASDRMNNRIYQDWLAVQLSDAAARRDRERAAAEPNENEPNEND